MATSKKDNMAIYNKFRNPPKEALKPISAGRLRGMTDINPMWRISCLTEAYGPCGEGWYYEITKQWIEDCGTEKVAITNINLYVKNGDEWSKPIIGTGGSKLSTQESKGVYVSDEAYKMSLTDAIGVAAKALGIGADIYWNAGRSKYTNTASEQPPKTTEKKEQINREQMIKICKEHYAGDNLAKLLGFYKVQNIEELDDNQLTVAYNTATKGR